MRMFTGYVMIILIIPLFIGLVFLSTTEAKQLKSFHKVLDDKISLEDTNLSQTSYIKDGDGNTISEIYKPMNRVEIPFKRIPSFLKELFVLTEDQNFYHHSGFDLAAIGRALAVNVSSKEIAQGGSTITQQLARNIYLNHEKTYNRKLSELLYAYQLERTYSKEEILELYINSIYFQHGAYGIEAASELYFHKKTNQLTKAQLAFLAAIPNNPTYYDPIQSFNRTKKRQERLLDESGKRGLLSTEEVATLKKEKINLQLKKRIEKFPDYTTLVESELRELVSKSEGYSDSIGEANSEQRDRLEQKLNQRVQEVIASGIIVYTALDPDLQKKAKAAVKKYLPYKDVEGSAAIINHKNKEIIALVGGKYYKKYNFNRAYQAYRQPGSSIKPLLVYAPYIERTNASLTDTINAGSLCIKGYCPQNYGGAIYGTVTLERAFMYSYNTPAVRLLNKTGIRNAFKDLNKFHFAKVSNQDYLLPSAVGGFTYGMTPLELTNAYTVFSNKGNYQPSRSIRQVTDLHGKVLYKWNETTAQVWKNSTIKKMRTLLNKVVVSGTGRKAYFASSYIGGKTGTTNDYQDFWFIGLTNDVTAGVWVGMDTPKNIQSIESSAPQLLIWREIVSGYKATKLK